MGGLSVGNVRSEQGVEPAIKKTSKASFFLWLMVFVVWGIGDLVVFVGFYPEIKELIHLGIKKLRS